MKWLLLPFSYLYAAGVWLRNKLFDWGVKKSVEFEVPIIVIGNLRVGGTGKTPHTEWLLAQLQEKYKVGMLSRGYGRRTRGFRWVEADDTAANCGDEPLQVKTKFPGVAVAVCEQRTEAIPEMVAEKQLDVIVLDDAFQHRYIKPTLTIVLSAVDKPFFEDEYLPAGRLREKGGALKRADIFIYTKVTPSLTLPPRGREPSRSKGVAQVLPLGEDLGGVIGREELVKKVKHHNPNISIYFSTYKYGAAINLKTGVPETITAKDVMVLTGIADAGSIIAHISSQFNVVKHFNYPDHFNYTGYDIRQWKAAPPNSSPSAPLLTSPRGGEEPSQRKEFEVLPPAGGEDLGGARPDSLSGAPIITTEKDAMRLRTLMDALEGITIYYLPIEVEILDDMGAELMARVTATIST